MQKRAILLVIDPQNDFCDPTKGSLYVNGADKDMERLATMVKNHGNDLKRIDVTLDSHHTVHIAHPIWWVNSKNEHPAPFTVISVDDVEKGVWRATTPAFQKWSLDYVRTLRDNKRYALCIWPYHCLIGTPGANVYPVLGDALLEWEKKFRMVNYVPKGSSIFTEHYSALRADVEFTGFDGIPADATTQLNTPFIETFKTDYDILIAGEAIDFCVANTARDIVGEMTDEQIKKLVLLEDASSAVNAPGLEHLKDDFINEMVGKGMRISKTTEYFN